MSLMGRFVPYHLMGCYNLSESAIDRSFSIITASYIVIEVFHGFKREQETNFSYKSHARIDDTQSGLWIVVFIERVCVALLIAAYSEFRLWFLLLDIIKFARELGMSMSVVLGSRANVR